MRFMPGLSTPFFYGICNRFSGSLRPATGSARKSVSKLYCHSKVLRDAAISSPQYCNGDAQDQLFSVYIRYKSGIKQYCINYMLSIWDMHVTVQTVRINGAIT